MSKTSVYTTTGFMAFTPTPAQWNAAKACLSFSLTYTDNKSKSTGRARIMTHIFAAISHHIY